MTVCLNFEVTLNNCYTLCFRQILPIALMQMNETAQVCFPLVVQLVNRTICCPCHTHRYILASNEKYSYLGACVFVHRSRLLLQLSDITLKMLDSVMLAVIRLNNMWTEGRACWAKVSQCILLLHK